MKKKFLVLSLLIISTTALQGMEMEAGYEMESPQTPQPVIAHVENLWNHCHSPHFKQQQSNTMRSKIIALIKKADKKELDLQNHRGWTALHFTVCVTDIEMAKALLKKGANPNSQTNTHRFTPLHMVLSRISKQSDKKMSNTMVDLLLRYNADPSLTDSHKKRPFDYLQGELNDLHHKKPRQSNGKEEV